MKIAIVNPEHVSLSLTGQGGIATYTYTMANALAALGHTVHVVARDGTVPDRLAPGVKLHCVQFQPAPGIGRYTDRFRNGQLVWEEGHSRAIRMLLGAIRRNDGLDVVEFPEYGGLAHQLGADEPFRIVINFHTPSELVDELNQVIPTTRRRAWHQFERQALGRARGYRCPSEALKRDVCARFGIPEDRVTVIRNPIETKQYNQIRKEAGNPDRIDLLFVGRLECRKGAELLVNALNPILMIDPRIQVSFAGETEFGDALSYRNALERRLSHDERDRVWFLGPVSRADLPLLYRRSGIFLMPSVFENAPYSLLEAMASELPVVAANTSGIKEIVSHDQNGLLFEPDDIGSLVACIARLIEAPDVARRLSARAAVDVRTWFSPAAIAAETISFYQSVIGPDGT